MFIWFLRSEAKLEAWRWFTQRQSSFLCQIRQTGSNILTETERVSYWVYLYDILKNNIVCTQWYCVIPGTFRVLCPIHEKTKTNSEWTFKTSELNSNATGWCSWWGGELFFGIAFMLLLLRCRRSEKKEVEKTFLLLKVWLWAQQTHSYTRTLSLSLFSDYKASNKEERGMQNIWRGERR